MTKVDRIVIMPRRYGSSAKISDFWEIRSFEQAQGRAWPQPVPLGDAFQAELPRRGR